MDVGSIIRLRRKSMGLTQKELSNRLGFKSSRMVSKIELDKNYRNKLTLERVNKISRVLKINPELFIEDMPKYIYR